MVRALVDNAAPPPSVWRAVFSPLRARATSARARLSSSCAAARHGARVTRQRSSALRRVVCSITEQEGAELMAEAQRVLNILYTRREMTPNEVKLVLMIEDPRAAQRREMYGVEVDSGVSRDDLVAALVDVQGGRLPGDSLALQQLVTELQAWPYLEGDEPLRGAASEPSPYAAVTNTGLSAAAQRAQAARAQAAAQEEIPEKDLSDYLPKWFGYSAVYLVSAIPVFITLAVLALLFVTSLK